MVFFDTSLMNDEILKMIIGILGYTADCELRNIKYRRSERLLVAKKKGVKLRRKRTYDQVQIAESMEKRAQGKGYGTIAQLLGMT